MKRTNRLSYLFAFLAVLTLACKEESEVLIVPSDEDAAFTYIIDATNPNKYVFSASPSVDTWYNHWNFGDGTSDEGLNVTKIFYNKGEFDVRFKIYATGGQASSTQTFTIAQDAVDETNLIKNGTFRDASEWTIVNLSGLSNTVGQVTIADGVAKFSESSTGDKHLGIYTVVNLEVGTYQFDMDMRFNDINNNWGEVYIGKEQPLDGGGDYNGDIEVLDAFNTWDCGQVKSYSGKATEAGCDSTNPGTFTITDPGEYYLIFRTGTNGGGQYGPDGIVIDNVELRKQ